MKYTPPTPEELRALFRAWQLTRGEAAKVLGCNPKTVSRWTGGQYAMNYATLYALAHIATGIAISQCGWRDELR